MFLGFGYNADINGVPFEKMILDMINSGSKIQLIMCSPKNGIPSNEDLQKLWQIYNLLKPVYGDELTLIWRFYNGYEGKWRYYDSKIYQAILGKMNLPPNTIIDSLSNEPELGNGSYLVNENYVRHELNILRDLKAVGVKYAVGAFSTGTPHESLIEKGVYDSLLMEAEYFSLHLYGVFPLEAGEILPYDLMLKTDSNRQKIRELFFNKVKWPKDYKGWLVGRLGWWESRCKILGIQMPEVIVTEHGPFDYIDNVPANIKADWSNSFNGGKSHRGIQTWLNHFQWVFPDFTLEQILVLLLTHIKNNILNKDYIKGILLFGYNRNWDGERGHNWENAVFTNFRNKHLKEVNVSVVVNNDEVNKKYDLIWSTDIINVRSDPSIKSDTNIEWQLTNTKEPVTILDKEVKGFENKYTWVKFLRHSDATIYYVAKLPQFQMLDVEEVQEEPSYIVDLLGMTQVFKKTDLQNLGELVNELKEFVEEINAEVDSDDSEYMITVFKNFLEVVEEADDVNREATVLFLDRILKGIKEAQVI